MSDTATSSNYYEVALHDDHANTSLDGTDVDQIQAEAEEATTAPTLDKAAARRQRIAAAVEKSKTEYKPEHAYTERKWYQAESSSRNVLKQHKVDRQHLEFVTATLYYADPPQYRASLDLVMSVFEPTAKSLGGLTRELLDTGIRSAIGCGDVPAAIALADCSRSQGLFAGLATSAADAYLVAGRPETAISPLLASISAFGMHYPTLQRLADVLREICERKTAQGLSTTVAEQLRELVQRAADWRKGSMGRPLFATGDPVDTIPVPSMGATQDKQAIDITAAAREIGLSEEDRKALDGVWRRLSKGVKVADTDEAVEKSVREL
ncbi:hypothetical protein CI109_107295 [Kwoniella shandongensis]|uniref:Uncharacterized protein n=1 Tax=Kwoniella shandongensis TaxID=1734106 RepID=A0AAJ8LQF9_9TREE